MEILAPCFAPPFREQLYPAVEAMQEILGRANDSRFAIARLEELVGQIEKSRPAGWKRKQTALAHFSSFQQRRLAQERRRFERWYKNWQKSAAQEHSENFEKFAEHVIAVIHRHENHVKLHTDRPSTQ